MHKTGFLLLFAFAFATAAADNKGLLRQLDEAILHRSQYIQEKEGNIAFLKKKLNDEKDQSALLKIIDDLYGEYYVYKFDSAMSYTRKGMLLAQKQDNAYYKALFTIHRAEILVFAGLYSEAISALDSLALNRDDSRLLFKYYYTYFSVYGYWADYCNDKTYTPFYRSKANAFLARAMQYMHPDDPLYEYYQGERMVYVAPDVNKARTHYHNILQSADSLSRTYAMAAFALAGNYQVQGNQEKYEEFLIKAAISDLKSCTMENMALQMLAVHLFQKSDSQIERAEHYINVSMHDAKFYNNRLRILEISRVMPQIMSAYQTVVKRQYRYQQLALFFISLLGIVLIGTAWFILRQNKKLTDRRKKLAQSNSMLTILNQQLADSNRQQAALNEQLKELNRKLVDTNKRREQLASIYIDLCAKYIDKLGKYQTLVKRKIKANQAMELLQTFSSTRISEDDASTFLSRFDKAFLDLYPTFVEEFNNLLLPENRIQLKMPNTLNTELRTFALIRLGVKTTADIAGLLFLSSQTIYNCRSVIKSRAINKDTFDDDVQHLCTVIHS